MVKKITLVIRTKINYMKEFNFSEVLKELSNRLSRIPYNNGDISDLGNEIGFVLGKYKITDSDIEDFISGLNHGISLSDGTH